MSPACRVGHRSVRQWRVEANVQAAPGYASRKRLVLEHDTTVSWWSRYTGRPAHRLSEPPEASRCMAPSDHSRRGHVEHRSSTSTEAESETGPVQWRLQERERSWAGLSTARPSPCTDDQIKRGRQPRRLWPPRVQPLTYPEQFGVVGPASTRSAASLPALQGRSRAFPARTGLRGHRADASTGDHLRDLADQIGVSVDQLRRMLRGESAMSVDRMHQLAHATALRVPIAIEYTE